MRKTAGLRILLLVLSTLSACSYELPSKLAEEASGHVKRARSLAESMDAKWQNAMERRDEMVPAWNRCPHELVPDHKVGYDHAMVTRFYGRVKGHLEPVDLVLPDDKEKRRSPRWQMVDRQLTILEHWLEPGQDIKKKWAKSIEEDLAKAGDYSDSGFWTQDVVVFVDREKEAEVIKGAHGLPATREEYRSEFMTRTTTPYTPGSISGRAYLFDYQSGEIACVGTFQATNTQEITQYSRNDLVWTLRKDLRGQALKAALLGLRKARRK